MRKPTVSFAVGTGRCGTTFLSRLVGMERGVAASHERHRLSDTYRMFCAWHGIPSDVEGFLVGREALVEADLTENRVSFEASALLSHALLDLHGRFARRGVRFVLLARHPVETVASFAARGWFLDPIPWVDRSLPPSLPEGMEPRHFFGRNLPRGPAFDDWLALGQVGRIAWFWAARNQAILEQFRQLPEGAWRTQQLEQLDHSAYVDLARFLGWETTVTSDAFDNLAASRPNTGPNPPQDPQTWTPLDHAELAAEVGPVARILGYELPS